MTQPVQQKNDVLQRLREHQRELLDYGVRKIGIFGSFVRGEQQADSDVDLLIEFREGSKNFDNFMNLSFLLEDVMSRKVELITPESLSPYIRPHVEREVEFVSFAA